MHSPQSSEDNKTQPYTSFHDTLDIRGGFDFNLSYICNDKLFIPHLNVERLRAIAFSKKISDRLIVNLHHGNAHGVIYGCSFFANSQKLKNGPYVNTGVIFCTHHCVRFSCAYRHRIEYSCSSEGRKQMLFLFTEECKTISLGRSHLTIIGHVITYYCFITYSSIFHLIQPFDCLFSFRRVTLMNCERRL